MVQDSREDQLIGQVIGGRYLVLDRIGAGGMGVVYRARESGLVEREVALKVINEVLSGDELVRRRFEAEVRIIAGLRHPNSISLLDAGRLPDGRLFMVMELLHGASLEEHLAAGPIEVTEVLSYFVQITAALAEAHARGIVHRDLKPANIFIDEVAGQRVPRILDFGIAKVADTSKLTGTASIIGTPGHMAPEQCMRGEVSSKSDIYALGLLLYACLAGRPAFEAAPGEALLVFLIRTVVEAPARLGTLVSVDPELEALVHAMLDTTADRRPADALEVQLRLRRIWIRLSQSDLHEGAFVEAEDVTEAGTDEPLGAPEPSVSGILDRFTGGSDSEPEAQWPSGERTFGVDPTVSQDAETDRSSPGRAPFIIVGQRLTPDEVLAIDAPQEPEVPARDQPRAGSGLRIPPAPDRISIAPRRASSSGVAAIYWAAWSIAAAAALLVVAALFTWR